MAAAASVSSLRGISPPESSGCSVRPSPFCPHVEFHHLPLSALQQDQSFSIVQHRTDFLVWCCWTLQSVLENFTRKCTSTAFTPLFVGIPLGAKRVADPGHNSAAYPRQCPAPLSTHPPTLWGHLQPHTSTFTRFAKSWKQSWFKVCWLPKYPFAVSEKAGHVWC